MPASAAPGLEPMASPLMAAHPERRYLDPLPVSTAAQDEGMRGHPGRDGEWGWVHDPASSSQVNVDPEDLILGCPGHGTCSLSPRPGPGGADRVVSKGSLRVWSLLPCPFSAGLQGPQRPCPLPQLSPQMANGWHQVGAVVGQLPVEWGWPGGQVLRAWVRCPGSDDGSVRREVHTPSCMRTVPMDGVVKRSCLEPSPHHLPGGRGAVREAQGARVGWGTDLCLRTSI